MSDNEWIRLTSKLNAEHTTESGTTTLAEYRYRPDNEYGLVHELRNVCGGEALRPSAVDDALYFTTAELAAIPIVKALVETLREFEEADIWGRSLGYLVCQMCGAKVTVGERFVHKDGCPYGVLVPFKEDNDDCI